MKEQFDQLIDNIPNKFACLIYVYNAIGANDYKKYTNYEKYVTPIINLLYIKREDKPQTLLLTVQDRFIISLYLKTKLIVRILKIVRNQEFMPTNFGIKDLKVQEKCIPRNAKVESVLNEVCKKCIQNRLSSLHNSTSVPLVVESLVWIRKQLKEHDTVCNAAIIYFFDLCTIQIENVLKAGLCK